MKEREIRAEGNIAEQLPILWHRNRDKYVIERWDENENVMRKVTIVGHPEYGLPGPKEYDVFIWMCKKFCEEGFKNNVEFTLTEIAKDLGEPPNLRMRIKKALYCLASLTFYWEKSFYHAGKWKSTTGAILHLGELHFNEKRGRGARFVFRFSDWIAENIKRYFYARLNWGVYRKLPAGFSKKLYLIYAKWLRNIDKPFTISLKRLAEYLGITHDQVTHVKRELERAHEALAKQGVIHYEYIDAGAGLENKYFKVIWTEQSPSISFVNESIIKEIAEELKTNWDFSDEQIEKILSKYNVEKIIDTMEYAKKRAKKDKNAYFLKVINESLPSSERKQKEKAIKRMRVLNQVNAEDDFFLKWCDDNVFSKFEKIYNLTAQNTVYWWLLARWIKKEEKNLKQALKKDWEAEMVKRKKQEEEEKQRAKRLWELISEEKKKELIEKALEECRKNLKFAFTDEEVEKLREIIYKLDENIFEENECIPDKLRFHFGVFTNAIKEKILQI